jgi:hypothetical protein
MMTQESRVCTAVVDVLPGLLAVWTVWSDEQTGMTAQKMANEQGTAIVQFVRRALVPAEDPTLVDEAELDHNRPGADVATRWCRRDLPN